MRALMTARMGRLGEAQRDLEIDRPFVSGMHVMGSSTMIPLGADLARVRGEREHQCVSLVHAIDIARKSGLGNFVAFSMAEAAFGAWLTGEDAEFHQHALTL